MVLFEQYGQTVYTKELDLPTAIEQPSACMVSAGQLVVADSVANFEGIAYPIMSGAPGTFQPATGKPSFVSAGMCDVQVSEAVAVNDELTIDPANPGMMKKAIATETIVAVAVEAAEAEDVARIYLKVNRAVVKA